MPDQAASAARLMRAEDVRAAVRESADLGQWLGPKAHDLLAAPLEIIAFSDEEGVRRAPSSHPWVLEVGLWVLSMAGVLPPQLVFACRERILLLF